jgi:hypothetical protein
MSAALCCTRPVCRLIWSLMVTPSAWCICGGGQGSEPWLPQFFHTRGYKHICTAPLATRTWLTFVAISEPGGTLPSPWQPFMSCLTRCNCGPERRLWKCRLPFRLTKFVLPQPFRTAVHAGQQGSRWRLRTLPSLQRIVKPSSECLPACHDGQACKAAACWRYLLTSEDLCHTFRVRQMRPNCGTITAFARGRGKQTCIDTDLADVVSATKEQSGYP